MSVKRLLAGVAVLCLVSFGPVSGAGGLSLDEYDRLAESQQENFISTVLHFYYYNYVKSPDTKGTADCMVSLDRSTAADGETYLLSRIMRDLDSARARSSGGRSVESVIKSVIERECEPT